MFTLDISISYFYVLEYNKIKLTISKNNIFMKSFLSLERYNKYSQHIPYKYCQHISYKYSQHIP